MSNYSFKIKVSEKVLTILERGTHTPEKLLRQKIQCQGKNNNKTKTQFACLDNVFYWFQRFLFQIYIYKKRLLMTCTTCDKGSWVHGFVMETWQDVKMRPDHRVSVCCRWQQLVEFDSTPTGQTEEETLPWTLLHGVRLRVWTQHSWHTGKDVYFIIPCDVY